MKIKCFSPSSVALSRLILFVAVWLSPLTSLRAADVAAAKQLLSPSTLELSRTDRPWEFLPITGTKAGLFGNEAGQFEAWVYPLKILRDFHLRFYHDGRVIPAETLARTTTVRPESSTLLYTSDTFAVRETLFVPVHEAGAVIIIEVETAQPLDVEAVFERDFQLEWPAGLGGTYGYWDAKLNAFYFGEEQKKFSAFVGSPTAGEVREEYDTNYSSSKENSFHLGVTAKGKSTKIVALAASTNGMAQAEATYHHLINNYRRLGERVGRLLPCLPRPYRQNRNPRSPVTASLRLVAHQCASRDGDKSLFGYWIDRRIPYLGREPASRLRVVFSAATHFGRLWRSMPRATSPARALRSNS